MTSSSDARLDELILSVVKPNWQKVAMVLAKALRLSTSRGVEASYEVLAVRIAALCMEGQLESEGNLAEWRRSEVRLPAKVSYGYPETRT
jgi:hypothetical protein